MFLQDSVDNARGASSDHLGRPQIMGILNLTPDSFYAGSRVSSLEEALSRALQMEEEGADILDVGGESTRPGAEAVSLEEEMRRTLDVLQALSRRVRIPLSIDTSKAEVAWRALEAGATILNDVSALRADSRMMSVALRYPHVVLMHMRGQPRTMQKSPVYQDVIGEISDFFKERLAAFRSAGGELSKVWLDPGVGFGKNLEHNLQILNHLRTFHQLGRPILLGASRKYFIGQILGTADRPLPPENRLVGSLAVACRAAMAGVFALRVHDVRETRQALQIWKHVSR